MVLLRMSPPQGGSRPLQLAVGYTDREGQQYRCVGPQAGLWAGLEWWGSLWQAHTVPLPAAVLLGPTCLSLLLHTALARSTKRTVGLPQQTAEAASGGGGTFFESSGVEKAVLLARYTDILHDW